MVATLSLCLGAMGATVYAESTGFELLLGGGEPAAMPTAAPVPEPTPAPASPRVPPPPRETDAMPTGVAPPAGVLVPNFEGERLATVFARAEAMGLSVSATDAFGERVPRRWARDYRVRRQLTEPGALVEEGTAVRLRVRSFGAATGY